MACPLSHDVRGVEQPLLRLVMPRFPAERTYLVFLFFREIDSPVIRAQAQWFGEPGDFYYD
jgi:hypothetical protein